MLRRYGFSFSISLRVLISSVCVVNVVICLQSGELLAKMMPLSYIFLYQRSTSLAMDLFRYEISKFYLFTLSRE